MTLTIKSHPHVERIATEGPYRLAILWDKHEGYYYNILQMFPDSDDDPFEVAKSKHNYATSEAVPKLWKAGMRRLKQLNKEHL